jgi:hypothetical protein
MFKNLPRRNFSVFAKLKEFMKWSSSSDNLFSTNVNPENIRAEYEEVDKIMKRKKQESEEYISKYSLNKLIKGTLRSMNERRMRKSLLKSL